MRAIRAFFINVLILLGGCQRSQVPPDPVKNELLVRKAQLYLSGGPTWFLAPSTCSDVIGSSNGYSQNTAGAVAWSIQIDDLSSFRQRIYNSTPANQTSWLQYTCVGAQQPCGFPFGSCVNSEDAGMVCWSMVLHALRDAGYDVPGPVGGCDYFNSLYSEVTGVVRIGDLVLHDWNRDGSYDHMGIISGNTT